MNKILIIFIYIITLSSLVANSVENVEEYPPPFGPFEWSDSEGKIIEKACKFINNDPNRIYVDLNYLRPKGDVCSLGMDNYISQSVYEAINSGDNLDKSAAREQLNLNLVQYGGYVIPSTNNTGKVIYVKGIVLKGVPYELSISGWGGSISNCTAREILEEDTGNLVTAFELPTNFPLEEGNSKNTLLYDHMIYDKYILTPDVDSNVSIARLQVILSGLELIQESLMDKYQEHSKFVLIKEKRRRVSHPNSPPLEIYGFGVLKLNPDIKNKRAFSVSVKTGKITLHITRPFRYYKDEFSFYFQIRTGEIGYNSNLDVEDLCGGDSYIKKLIKKVSKEGLKNQTQDDSSQL